jgi:signal transduction histidine kinase
MMIFSVTSMFLGFLAMVIYAISSHFAAKIIFSILFELLILKTSLDSYKYIISPIESSIEFKKSLFSPHQSKEENLYKELRTRFAFHNITKDVRNLKSYITILKHEEPQLSSKFNTLDELTDMIEDTLSKFKNSDTIRTKNPFLVHELFDNFLILNKPDLVREGSDLQIEYQKTEYKNIEIHQIFYEVYQVLNNLIDNARKAIANVEQKEIQILTSVSKEGFIDFRVSDTGVGIDAKARNRVFDIGYSTTKGDGLGLLFAQTTLKRFGGEIQLLPTAISGFSTTFEVRIPTQKG